MSEDDAYEVLARNCDLSRGEDMHKYWCGEQYEYRGLPHPVVARSLHALVRKVFVMAVFSSNDDFLQVFRECDQICWLKNIHTLVLIFSQMSFDHYYLS